MANIAQQLSHAHNLLREADDLSHVNSPDQETIERVITACQTLVNIANQQEERNQRIAQTLDDLAERIGFLSSSPRDVREKIHQCAALVRGEGDVAASEE